MLGPAGRSLMFAVAKLPVVMWTKVSTSGTPVGLVNRDEVGQCHRER
jgi:hypothetical protein